MGAFDTPRRHRAKKRSKRCRKTIAKPIENLRTSDPKNVGISPRKPSKIDPRASWAALAETNGLQVLLRGSKIFFLIFFPILYWRGDVNDFLIRTEMIVEELSRSHGHATGSGKRALRNFHTRRDALPVPNKLK